MAEFLYYLTVFTIKVVILSFALVAVVTLLILSTPYALLWPTPKGMTWGQAARARFQRVMKVVLVFVEVANAAIDTPA